MHAIRCQQEGAARCKIELADVRFKWLTDTDEL